MLSKKAIAAKCLYTLIFGISTCTVSIFYLITVSDFSVAHAQFQSWNSDPCYMIDDMEQEHIQDPQQFPISLVSVLGGDTYYLSTGSTIAPSFDYSSRGAGTTSLSWPAGWAPNSFTDSKTFVVTNSFNCPTTSSTSIPYVSFSSPKIYNRSLAVDGGNANISIGQFVIALSPKNSVDPSVDPLAYTLSSCWGNMPFFTNIEPYYSRYKAWCDNYYVPW